MEAAQLSAVDGSAECDGRWIWLPARLAPNSEIHASAEKPTSSAKCIGGSRIEIQRRRLECIHPGEHESHSRTGSRAANGIVEVRVESPTSCAARSARQFHE